MSDRIERLFSRCRNESRAAFIPYICAGDPSFRRTVEITLALEHAGADLLELGVPFSDPLADGIVNQLAAQRALEAGATLRGVLACVREIRERSEIPIVLYTYLNPMVQFGLAEFYREAETAGVDGLLILDLPPDERVEAPSDAIAHIRLIAPTTPPKRIESICARGAGFIYYVSREGVTGAQTSVAVSLAEKVKAIRAVTDLPIAVGFGVSNPEQAAEVAKHADAVVVGSAIVSQIVEHGAEPKLADKIEEFVRPLAAATRSART